MKKNRLTPRELEVMEILWKHDEPFAGMRYPRIFRNCQSITSFPS